MARLGEIGTRYITTNGLQARFGRPAEPCGECGCCILVLLHTGEVVCGECGPPGRAAHPREIAYWGIVVVEPDGRHVLAELEAERKAAAESRERRDEIDLSHRGHGRWRRVAGGWRRVG